MSTTPAVAPSGKYAVVIAVLAVLLTVSIGLNVRANLGGAGSSPAASAGAPSEDAGSPPPSSEVPSETAASDEPAPTGEVAVDSSVAQLERPVAPDEARTQDGAVAAFAEYAVWLTSSEAARDEPVLAVEEVSDVLDAASAQLLMSMNRSSITDFRVETGGYRVLAVSGDEQQPDQVMVELAAQMVTGSADRWLLIGGVVSWTDSRWQLVSITPRETEQPQADSDSVTEMTVDDQTRVLDGLGWSTFANQSASE